MEKLPNLISAVRLFLSPAVLYLSYVRRQEEAALIFFLLALSDALDGLLARRLKAQTLLGKLLDPLADKVLLLMGLASVTFFTDVRTNPLLLILLLLRDLFLVIGSLFLRRFGFVPEPSIYGKLTTLSVSITVILAFLLNLYFIDGMLIVLKGLEILSIVLVLISWTDYALRGVSFLRSKLIIERK